jgi:hypothetical protein
LMRSTPMKSTAPMEQSNEKNSNSHEYAVELILHLSRAACT